MVLHMGAIAASPFDVNTIKISDELKKTLSTCPVFIPLIITSYFSYLNDFFVLAYILFYAAIMVFCLPSWRIGLLAFLLWLLYFGTLRKWFFPAAQKALYFTPHFFVISCFLSFLVKGELKQKRYRPGAFYSFYILLLCYSFFSVIISLSVHPYMGIVGFLMHYSFLPLVVMLPAMFENMQDIKRFAIYVTLISIIPFTISFIQYNEPYDSWWNKLLASDSVTTRSRDGTVRISSTFTYPGGYGGYLVFIFAILLWSSFAAKKRGAIALFATILAICIINIFFCNMRSATMPCMAMLFLLCVYSFVTGSGYKTRLVTMAAVAVVSYFVFFNYLVTTGTDPFDTSMKRVFNAGTGERLVGSITPNLTSFYGIFGIGIGSQCHGVSTFAADITNKQYIGYIEDSLDKMFAEMGLLGVTLGYGIVLSMLALVILRLKRLKSTDLKLLLLLLSAVVCTYGYNLLQFHNYSSNAWFHIAAGIIVGICSMDERKGMDKGPYPAQAGPD